MDDLRSLCVTLRPGALICSKVFDVCEIAVCLRVKLSLFRNKVASAFSTSFA